MRATTTALGLTALASLLVGCTDPPPPPVETVVPTEQEADAPPPVTGGSLLVESGYAVAADTGQDALFIVDIGSDMLLHQLTFEPGDAPGRVHAGPTGSVYVSLRRGGALAQVDLASGAIKRRDVCAAPRGIAYDAPAGVVHVACASGELVSLAADLEGPLTSRFVRRDLRDVTISGDKLLVSVFRSAHVLVVDADGNVEREVRPHNFTSLQMQRAYEPAVAWRMVPLPTGEAIVVHQRALAENIPTGPSSVPYYGGSCDQSIIHGAATVVDSEPQPGDEDLPFDAPVTTLHAGGIGNIVLPVDIAVSPGGAAMTVVGAGMEAIYTTSLTANQSGDALDSCDPWTESQSVIPVLGEPISVQYLSETEVLVQTRQPASLSRVDLVARQVVAQHFLPGPSRRDWGHALFHRAATDFSPIACASCHPEGRDDGHVWQFETIGPRRTQTVNIGVMDTMPLHWDGDMTSLHDLMGEVFVNRMGGVEQPSDRIEALGDWMQGLQTVPVRIADDAAAVARGEEIFFSAEAECATCHGGAALTNNENHDVGTGKAFQVPSLLGIGDRAPFMHDGCATTLADRFDPACGGGDKHGKTSHLSPGETADLIAYLETL